MIGTNEYFNFVEGDTDEIIDFQFQLEGENKEIDFIDYGDCPCTKGDYDPVTKIIKGTLDLSMIGVNHGIVYNTKYIKVYLDPNEPERITAGELPTDAPLYKKGSLKAVINPKKRRVTLTLAGDVRFKKKTQ